MKTNWTAVILFFMLLFVSFIYDKEMKEKDKQIQECHAVNERNIARMDSLQREVDGYFKIVK